MSSVLIFEPTLLILPVEGDCYCALYKCYGNKMVEFFLLSRYPISSFTVVLWLLDYTNL